MKLYADVTRVRDNMYSLISENTKKEKLQGPHYKSTPRNWYTL